MMLMATSLNFSRTFSFTAASAFPYEARLVPQPPDLIKLVRKEVGFVHHSVKIVFLEYEKRSGIGIGLVASEDIAKGDVLISLPSHIPLRFEAKDRESSALIDLGRQIPDYGFIVPSIPYDCIVLRYDSALLDAASTVAGVSSPKFSSLSSWQQQLLSLLNLDGENSDLKVRIGGSELVEGRLLAALRVLLSDNEEAVQKHDLDTLKSISSVGMQLHSVPSSPSV